MFNFVKDKRCPRCDERKPRDEFYDCDRSNTGLSSWCIECTRERRKERYAEQRTVNRESSPEEYDYTLSENLRRALGETS